MGKKKGGGIRVKQLGPKGGTPKLINPMEDLMVPPEDMVHLPPPPDRSYQIFWPIHETFSMDPTSFRTIYPSYLDSTKTVHLGRRISQDKAVPTPTVTDLSSALQLLGLRHVIQPYKGYPRDVTTLWDNPGRVRVEPTELYTKRGLLIEIAAKIPTLPSRIQRLEQEEAARVAQEMEEAIKKAEIETTKRPTTTTTTTPAKSATTTASTSTNKKKGKKKK